MEEDWLKKMINYKLIESVWKAVEVSISKTYTNLTNLTNAFDQSASASQSIIISTNVSISDFLPPLVYRHHKGPF